MTKGARLLGATVLSPPPLPSPSAPQPASPPSSPTCPPLGSPAEQGPPGRGTVGGDRPGAPLRRQLSGDRRSWTRPSRAGCGFRGAQEAPGALSAGLRPSGDSYGAAAPAEGSRPAAQPRREPAGPRRPYPLSPLTSAILGALGLSSSDAPSARMGPLSQWQPDRD